LAATSALHLRAEILEAVGELDLLATITPEVDDRRGP